MIKTKIIPQSSLTSDCWLVQFRGFNACAECPEYLGLECGGGKTLIKKIHGLGDSVMSGWKTQEYFNDNPESSFYEYLEYAENEGVMRYGIKKYKNQVRQIQEANKQPIGLDLDLKYPFNEVYNNPDNEILFEESYHQSNQCNCDYTTRSGSYSDVKIRTKNGDTLFYYHQHCIKAQTNEGVFLSSCGYRTVTTLKRLNSYSSYWIIQRKYVWYIQYRGVDIPFYDGINVSNLDQHLTETMKGDN